MYCGSEKLNWALSQLLDWVHEHLITLWLLVVSTGKEILAVLGG